MDSRGMNMKQPDLRKWRCTGTYAVLQAATWSFYAIVMAFSSNVLYEYGYSDSAISLVMGLSTALSVAVQVGSGNTQGPVNSKFPGNGIGKGTAGLKIDSHDLGQMLHIVACQLQCRIHHGNGKKNTS